MKNKNIFFMVLVLIFTLAIAGCVTNEKEPVLREAKTLYDEEYKKCTGGCAATIGSSESDEDYVTLNLCRENCKKQFLKRVELTSQNGTG